MRFLTAALVPWPSTQGPHALAVTSPATRRVAIYDNALAAMVLLRDGRTRQAGQLLMAATALQQTDGSLPFSFALPSPTPGQVYVRTGALAWLGYAAVEYVDAGQQLAGREAILVMAHRIATYLLAHQVERAGDPRDGLVTGGSGSYRYEIANDEVRELFVPGEVAWASTEHNIDTFFFLRALGRLSRQTEYRAASDRIARALVERGWMAEAGQLARGFHESGLERGVALDCASWGALFLVASGRRLHAETALSVADGRYASTDGRGIADGHKPYAHAPLLENVMLSRHFAGKLLTNEWDKFDAVWPEGSAGVALAALRLGFRRRATIILDRLEPLRVQNGGLPTLTSKIPFEFDTEPSIAGTAWTELVRFELGRQDNEQRLWADP